ncbi:MAG: polysaccharide deacetylase family protein [Clostridia bacterium]|nr:polysaccharide deacetylase family protein [Clostridia bacterium]
MKRAPRRPALVRSAIALVLGAAFCAATACTPWFAASPGRTASAPPGAPGSEAGAGGPSPGTTAGGGSEPGSAPGAAPGSAPGSAAASETGPQENGAAPDADALRALGLTPSPAQVRPGPLQPNEAGQIMVLMYHAISKDSRDWRWTRTPDGFRQDLEALYERGYRPVNMVDVARGTIDVPRGYTPVVLTFDDSTEGQLRFLPAADGSDAPPATLREAVERLDPDCAVGILVAFHEKHPDWPLRASFYVNAGTGPFGPRAQGEIKLRLLAALGFEIGNHTYTHENLNVLSPEETQKQLALDQAAVARAVPGYELLTLALPFGGYPKRPDLLKSGEADGTRYRNLAFLLVGANPAPSPYLQTFDPYRVPRVQVVDPARKLEATFPYTWLAELDRHPERRFVSDGDPATVSVPREAAAKVRPGNWRVVVTDGSE